MPVVDLVIAIGEQEHRRKVRNPTTEKSEHVERRTISPMHVIDHQERRRPRAELGEHGREHGVLVGAGRQGVGERPVSSSHRIPQRPQRARRQQVLAGRCEHPHIARERVEKSPDQAGLADPRVTQHQGGRTVPGDCSLDERRERAQPLCRSSRSAPTVRSSHSGHDPHSGLRLGSALASDGQPLPMPAVIGSDDSGGMSLPSIKSEHRFCRSTGCASCAPRRVSRRRTPRTGRVPGPARAASCSTRTWPRKRSRRPSPGHGAAARRLERALDEVGARLAERAADVTFVVGDVLDWRPDRSFDLWHDRAVYHFLVDGADRLRYVELAARTVRRGSGALVIAGFAGTGPAQCSGLPVSRALRQRV